MTVSVYVINMIFVKNGKFALIISAKKIKEVLFHLLQDTNNASDNQIEEDENIQ